MISSSERRVLDDLDPDSTKTGRDRHTFHDRPEGDVSTPQFHRQPAITTKSIYGPTSNRLANQWPARLAFQLEAPLGRSTILSNAGHPEEPSFRFGGIKALGFAAEGVGLAGSWQRFRR